ncbi:MAG: outer membrane protein assembly factor BamD [Chitinophagaceae bacterium]|nr:outer membrane protein assembly factor BamD [Rubrivivax sp.]
MARAGRNLLLPASLAGLVALTGCGSPPKNESAAVTAERLYKDAKEDADSGSFERAIKSLERVEGLAAGTLLAQQALLDLAYLQWKAGEREQALTAVERFIKLNPSSPAFDYALYLRGVINFNDNLGLLGIVAGQDLSERDQRASREAYQAFKRLVDLFPNSRYAADARLRMDYIVNSLASYEVHVAGYYLRRGAYVAAANRAQQMIAEYPRTPATEEALAIMVQSYDKLELAGLRDDAQRVLRQNFPQSRFLGGAGGSGNSGKPWWQLW